MTICNSVSYQESSDCSGVREPQTAGLFKGPIWMEMAPNTTLNSTDLGAWRESLLKEQMQMEVVRSSQLLPQEGISCPASYT